MNNFRDECFGRSFPPLLSRVRTHTVSMNQSILLKIILLLLIAPFLILLGLFPLSIQQCTHPWLMTLLFSHLILISPASVTSILTTWPVLTPSVPLTSLRALRGISCPLSVGRRARAERTQSREQSGERWWEQWWRLWWLPARRRGKPDPKSHLHSPCALWTWRQISTQILSIELSLFVERAFAVLGSI